MATQGRLSYELVEGWEHIPQGFTHHDVSGVAVDSSDRVYLLTRFEPRVMVYEPDGAFITSWGEKLFTNRTHGITIGMDDEVYITDDADQTVRKFTTDGRLLMTIGTSGLASDTGYDIGKGLSSIVRGGPPFNRPTNLAIAANGDLYVSDGYGNARIHRFSADGRLIQSWGEPGTGPGQFNLPHDVRILPDSRVIVADRENDRLQIFSPTGEFLDQWTHVQRPCGLFVDREGLIYVGELSWVAGQRSMTHGPITENRAGRVTVLDQEGNILTRWGGPDCAAPGNFVAPHAVCSDSRGSVYVAEVTQTFGVKNGVVPPGTHTFQKFARQ